MPATIITNTLFAQSLLPLFPVLQVLNVGSFPTELDAARAWNAAAIHFRGRDTWLNPVEPQLPEDGGVAVAEKLPQPPWGSLLLSTLDEVAQQHEREGTQQAAADGQQEQ